MELCYGFLLANVKIKAARHRNMAEGILRIAKAKPAAPPQGQPASRDADARLGLGRRVRPALCLYRWGNRCKVGQ